MAKSFDDLMRQTTTKRTRQCAASRTLELLGELVPGRNIVKPKRIRDARSYRQAIKEIEILIDARPNTPEGDRLDALVTLADAWEEKHQPID